MSTSYDVPLVLWTEPEIRCASDLVSGYYIAYAAPFIPKGLEWAAASSEWRTCGLCAPSASSYLSIPTCRLLLTSTQSKECHDLHAQARHRRVAWGESVACLTVSTLLTWLYVRRMWRLVIDDYTNLLRCKPRTTEAAESWCEDSPSCAIHRSIWNPTLAGNDQNEKLRSDIVHRVTCQALMVAAELRSG